MFLISYNSTFYQQLDGTPMGAPISPMLAALVINEIAYYIVNKLPFNVDIFHIYVEDTLLLMPDYSIQLVLHIFNSFYPKLKFTKEIKNNKIIHF